MSGNINFFITIIISFLSMEIMGQSHTIFLDDTMYYTKRYPLFDPYPVFNVTFKDSLEDGKWVLHNLQRKDSAKQSDKTIILTGEFKNYQRNGVFNDYMRTYTSKNVNKKKKKYDISLRNSDTYVNEVREGMSMFILPHTRVRRYMTYSDGKKNGFDVSFFDDNSQFIRYYEYDILIYESFYINRNELFDSRVRQNDGSYILTQYNKKGVIERIYQYKKGEPYRYRKFYPNQFIEQEMEGDLEFSHYVEMKEKKYTEKQKSSIPRIAEYKLIRGVERRYNIKGELLYEKYVD